MSAVSRLAVDLSEYPDLVVVYLGMQASSLGGFFALMKLGPQIAKAAAAKPDGLLRHEGNIVMGLLPLHMGMRQYWRDLESLEKWTRTSPHLDWWRDFMSRPKGVTFWRETYCIRGGIEAVFLGPDKTGSRPGLLGFAPSMEGTGAMSSARRRLKREGAEPPR